MDMMPRCSRTPFGFGNLTFGRFYPSWSGQPQLSRAAGSAGTAHNCCCWCCTGLLTLALGGGWHLFLADTRRRCRRVSTGPSMRLPPTLHTFLARLHWHFGPRLPRHLPLWLPQNSSKEMVTSATTTAGDSLMAPSAPPAGARRHPTNGNF
jgi:hypothetical protein